jgi:hypothetical protein
MISKCFLLLLVFACFVADLRGEEGPHLYFDRLAAECQAVAYAIVEGHGIVNNVPVPVHTDNTIPGPIGLTSTASVTVVDGAGTASGEGSSDVEIALTAAEQAVDGPSMMALASALAETDHEDEEILAGFTGIMRHYLRLIISSTTHPNNTSVEYAIKCAVLWSWGNVFYSINLCWVIDGPIPAFAYDHDGHLCVDTVEFVDYMGELYPVPVTICSEGNFFYDPVGGVYVDVSGIAKIGDEVRVYGSSETSPASLNAGGYTMASGVDNEQAGGAVTSGYCWVQLGDVIE